LQTLTKEQHQAADAAVALVLTLPPDNAGAALKAVMELYCKSLAKAFPDLTEEQIAANAANYCEAIMAKFRAVSALAAPLGSA
jgi:hypothetical protein